MTGVLNTHCAGRTQLFSHQGTVVPVFLYTRFQRMEQTLELLRRGYPPPTPTITTESTRAKVDLYPAVFKRELKNASLKLLPCA